MKKSSRSLLEGPLLYLAFLAGIVTINWLLFRYIFDQNYFIWYITNGTLIGIIVGFTASIWEGLDSRNQLLSAHPGYYIQGCFGLMAAFFASVAFTAEQDPDYKTDQALNRWFNFGLDTINGFVVILFMSFALLAWLVVVAPLNYFMTLLTGAIARKEILGKYKRAIAIQTDTRFILTSISRKEKLPDHAVNISLAVKPFAITQTITALVLFVANKLLI